MTDKFKQFGESFLTFLRNLSVQAFLFSIAFFKMKSILGDGRVFYQQWVSWLVVLVLILTAALAMLINQHHFANVVKKLYFEGENLWKRLFVFFLFMALNFSMLIAVFQAAIKFATDGK